jgi:transposase-like protein
MTEPLPAASRLLCPYCRSVETARPHRRGPIEKYLLRAIQIRVYRCDDCNSRFYALYRSNASASRPSPAARRQNEAFAPHCGVE